MESITFLDNIRDQKFIIHTSLAAQGDGDSIKKYTKTLVKSKKADRAGGTDAEDFFEAAMKGFKGLE